ncbi:MAG: GDSL family lipase [Ruminococcus sp.]|nr:GDSL family lipase [Ruminococcus sp.]
MKKQMLTADNCRFIGRTYDTGGDVWFALSGTGVEFKFKGSKLTLVFLGDEVAEKPDNEDNYPRVAVYADGKRAADTQIDSAEKTVTVFSDGEHDCVVRVIKLSECAMSCVGISCAETDDGARLLPTEAKPHRIEFIGDSITCGYGVDDEDPLHHFKCATEDVTRAYAYKTAEALGAEYSMFSTSGYGIITGYTEGDEKITEQRIPLYYESFGFSFGSFAGRKPHDIPWDFSRYVPELVVMNLGTNDDSYCRDHADRQADYTENYTAFLKTVRRRNPDAYILCAVGIMGQRIFPALEKAVADHISQTGDSRISTMLFDEQDGEHDGLVADYHPTEVTHTKAANALSAEIRRIMGW